MCVKQHSSFSLLRLLPVYVVIFIGFVGYSLMITVFTPMLLAGHNGLLPTNTTMSQRTILLGFLLALYPLGQFFAAPVLGALSDRFGRKPVLLVSLNIAVCCYVLIALALTWHNLTLLIVSLLLAGFSEANIAIAQSAIADVSTMQMRNRLFGYIYLSASSAYIIGPLVGGKLAAWFGNAMPFWAICILLLVTIVATIFAFRETRPPELAKHIHFIQAFTNLTGLFTNRKVRKLYLINFLLFLAIFGFFRCYPMYLVNKFHMDVSHESIFIAWVSVPIILCNLGLTGIAANFFTAKQITIVTAILTGFFMIVIIIPQSENALWITLFLTPLALALCLPACTTLLSVTADFDEQGGVMGNNQALNVGAEAISGVVGGLLAAISIKLPLIILAFIAIAAGIMLFFLKTDGAAAQPV